MLTDNESSDGEDQALDLFNEPDGYYEAEKPPTTVTHRTQDGRELQLRLVGHNPLWVGLGIQFIPQQSHFDTAGVAISYPLVVLICSAPSFAGFLFSRTLSDNLFLVPIRATSSGKPAGQSPAT